MEKPRPECARAGLSLSPGLVSGGIAPAAQGAALRGLRPLQAPKGDAQSALPPSHKGRFDAAGGGQFFLLRIRSNLRLYRSIWTVPNSASGIIAQPTQSGRK